MAKSIKANECPKCGSTQKAPVQANIFRCESCGTGYFLDDDDGNLNYTVRQQTGQFRGSPGGGIAMVMLLMAGQSRNFSTKTGAQTTKMPPREAR